MFELFAALTDDQQALAGCAAALVVSAGVLAASGLFGRRRRTQTPSTDAPTTLRVPAAPVSGHESSDRSTLRRAA